MSENLSNDNPNPDESSAKPADGLERGTYEIIQNRLKSHAAELRTRLDQLNADRREVFGSIPTLSLIHI